MNFKLEIVGRHTGSDRYTSGRTDRNVLTGRYPVSGQIPAQVDKSNIDVINEDRKRTTYR